MIKLENISVCYGDNTVYSDFSFELPCGVNVILGKSGCGKTTLLNVISKLVPHQGVCKTEGKIAVVFQDPCLAPVSVWKNIDLVLGKGDNSAQIRDILQIVGLAEKSEVNVKKLSGGEKQRVSLARAFATDREILLLDEPFANLDYGVKKQLQRVFDDLLKAKPKTVVWVTHDIDECLAIADRVYFLSGSPCTLQSVVRLETERSLRNEFDPATLETKKRLQKLLQL